MLEQFFSDLAIPECVIQVGEEHNVLQTFETLEKTVLESLLTFHGGKNFYFLAGIRNAPELSLNRAKDSDINLKNYFYIDFDIRKEFPKLTDEEIKTWGREELVRNLASHQMLSRWRYIVFTGNGVHLYYFGDEPIKISEDQRNQWKQGLTVWIERTEELSGRIVDKACVNPARIARLPGSINYKHGNEIPTEILKFQDSRISLETVFALGRKRIEEITKAQEEQFAAIKREFPSEQDTYRFIRALPVSQVVTKLFGWVIAEDGIHFTLPGSRKHKACFVSKNDNIVAHGGSEHIPHDQPAYNSFALVKAVKALTNRDTFQWFRDNFPEVKSFADRELLAKRLGVPKGKSVKDIFAEMQSDTIRALKLDPELNPYLLVVRGKVTRIGAIFGTGKSKFGYFLCHMLLRHGYRGAIFSTEVDEKEVLAHLLSIPLSRTFKDILDRRVQVNEEVLNTYRNVLIYDVMSTNNSLFKIENIIKLEQDGARSGGYSPLDFIMIDYSQMITPKTVGMQETYQWAKRYGAELQEIAQKYEVSVIDICQLGKDGLEDRNEKYGYVPFEGGGTLNQSADVAIMMKRDKSLLAELADENHTIVDIRKSKPLQRRVQLEMAYNWSNSTYKFIRAIDPRPVNE